MKRCPTCNKTFTDRNLSFCIDDGTPLATIPDIPDEETVVSPSSQSSARKDQNFPPYQPPGTYAPPGTAPGQTRRKVWPWVVGILALVLLVIAGLGIAAAILIPRMLKAPVASNTNSNRSVYRSDNSNRSDSNSNSQNANDNLNGNGNGTDSAPPADEEKVLADLTDLENEWTVANINADKNKLDRILGDDYVGTYADGQTQGKAEYLRTIKRDTTIQKWEFEDLDVDLNGDRASLTGIIRLQIDDKPVVYRFTDKFVWRDGRWQAVASDVTPIK